MRLSARVLVCLASVLCSPGLSWGQESEVPVDSAYADMSWKGLGDFWTYFERSGRTVRYVKALDSAALELAGNREIFVWIRPEKIDSDLVVSAVERGARFIILDESECTVDWYRMFYGQDVVSVDSPEDSSVAHINQRSALPVLSAGQIQKNTPHLTDGYLRVAFNHPSPLILKNGDDVMYSYVWAWPDGDKPGIWVIRDESFLRRLMLHTLDNSKYLELILEKLCPENVCVYYLYEPGVALVEERTDLDVDGNKDGKKDDSWASEKLDSLLRRVDSIGEDASGIAWRIVVMGLLVLWLVLIFIATMQIKRRSEE